MTIRIKKISLTLGLLTGMAIMIMVWSKDESPEEAAVTWSPSSETIRHYVVENGTQWIMQSATSFLQIK